MKLFQSYNLGWSEWKRIYIYYYYPSMMVVPSILNLDPLNSHFQMVPAYNLENQQS